jgi:hypothetical protein
LQNQQGVDAEGTDQSNFVLGGSQKPRGFFRSEDTDGMGMEGHDNRTSAGQLGTLKRPSDHRLMTEVDAVKNADRKVRWSGNGFEFGDVV